VGDVIDQQENGEICQCCGQWLLEDHGYYVTCTDCGGEAELFVNASDEDKIKNGWVEKGVDMYHMPDDDWFKKCEENA